MAFTFGPAVRPAEGVDRFVKVTVRQITLAIGILHNLHIDHMFKHEQPDSCLGFVSVYKIRFQAVIPFGRNKKFPYYPVPVKNLKDTRKLIPF